MTVQLETIQSTSSEIEDPSWKRLYKVGGIAAMAVVAIALIQAPIFILFPQPTTVIGHFAQFQSSRLLGLVDLDLMLMLAEVFTIPILFALYAALKKVQPRCFGHCVDPGPEWDRPFLCRESDLRDSYT